MEARSRLPCLMSTKARPRTYIAHRQRSGIVENVTGKTEVNAVLGLVVPISIGAD